MKAFVPSSRSAARNGPSSSPSPRPCSSPASSSSGVCSNKGPSLLQPDHVSHPGPARGAPQGPKAFRPAIWTLAYDFFFRIQTFFAMILVAIVGPDLISQDLRFNAMPLYLSRPLRRIDYFLGKLGVIAFFLGAVAILPAIAAYLLGLAFSFEFPVLQATPAAFSSAPSPSASLSCSPPAPSCSPSPHSPAAPASSASLWVGFWIVSGMASQVLKDTTRQDWCPLVSYSTNLGPHARRAARNRRRPATTSWACITRTRDAARDAAMRATPFGRFAAPPRQSLSRPRPSP